MKKFLLFLLFYLAVLQCSMAQTPAQLNAFKASSPLFQSKYYKANVWDVQRSPAYPTANASWNLGGFAAPYDASNSLSINWGASNNRYLQFDLVKSATGSYTDDILGSGNKFNIVLKLYESNGTFVKNLCTSGAFMGFGDKGFLFEQDNSYGTFFANDSYITGGSVTYTPTTGTLNKLSQLSNYKYSPQLIKPTVSVTTFTYNGQQQGVSIATNSAYTITGTTSAVNAGTYIVTISLKDKVNDSWSDGTTDDVVISWTIESLAGIDKPIVNTTSFTYNGSEQGIGIATSSSYGVTGVASAINAGKYTATISLNDKANKSWNDGTKDDIVINWSITKAAYDMSTARWDYTEPFIWDGTQKAVSVSGLPSGVTVKSYTNNTATNVGSYTATALLDYDIDNYNEPIIPALSWEIKQPLEVAKPSVNAISFIYNGSDQGISIATSNSYSVTGVVSAVNVGTYTATITLNDKAASVWDDGTKDDVVITWSITYEVAKPTVNAISFTYNGGAQGVGIATSRSYTITGVASAINVGTYTATIALNDKATSAWDDGSKDDIVINWSVTKATYDMSAARWDYTEPFTCDGTQKAVSLTGLPAGVTVNSYTGNTATNAGSYTATALLDYDEDNYHAPVISSLNWVIKTGYLNLSIIKLWDNVLAVSNREKYDDIRNATFRWYKDGVLLQGNQQYIPFEGSIPAGSYKVEIVINSTVAVTLSYAVASTSVKAYPNPVQSGQSLTVEMGEIRPDNEQAEVLSISGSPVKASIERQASGYRISGLPQGTYLVRIFTPGQTITTVKIAVK